MTNINNNNHEQTLKSSAMTRIQAVNQAVNQAMDKSINESFNESINQPTNKPINQPTTQPTNHPTTTTTTTTPTPSPIITTTPLGLWNNVAPRVYTPRALCFPFSATARLDPLSSASTILWFLRIQLLRIVKARPAFAGKLQLGINLSESDKRDLGSRGVYNDWHVYLQTCEGYEIPLVAQYPDDEEVKGMYAGLGIEEGVEEREVKGWPREYVEYDNLKRAEFPVEPFINPLLTDLSTLKEGGEALPAVQVRILFLRGGFILNVLGHHTLFDGGAFTQFLNILAEHTRSLSPQWEGFPESHDLGLSLPGIEKPYEELLAKCPEYKEWEGHEPNGPTHPVCPSLREGESLTGSSKIFVFTFAKLVQLQKEIAAHGVKAGIYECLSGLLWALTYFSRVTASSSSADHSTFERFLHDHFASEQPVFSTPTDWIARVAGLKSSADPKVVAFKEQIAKDTKEYLGNKITWISTRLPSASLLIDTAKEPQDLAALAKVVAAINKSSTDMAENMQQYITVRTSLFAALSQSRSQSSESPTTTTSDSDSNPLPTDIRHIGLSFDPRQPSEWQMNSWKNFGADTEWRFPPLPSLSSPSVLTPMVPANSFCSAASASYSHRDAFNVTKPDAVRRVQARYGVSGGLWLPARKEQKEEVLVQVSLPEEAMGVFEGVVLGGGWVERVV